jgi:hypothetical protein
MFCWFIICVVNMSKTTAYITVFFGSLTAMIISAAILTPEIASGIIFVTVLLAIFTLIAISFTSIYD